MAALFALSTAAALWLKATRRLRCGGGVERFLDGALVLCWLGIVFFFLLAGLGAIIGAATGNAGASAGIGAAVGLLGGALIGDWVQKKEQEEKYQQDQLRQTQLELERQRREIVRLKRQKEY